MWIAAIITVTNLAYLARTMRISSVLMGAKIGGTENERTDSRHGDADKLC